MIVLNIDDDIDDREVFCEAVKEVDPEIICLTTDSAQKAFDLLKNDMHPDYIFLDINMPKMTGFECLKQLMKTVDFNSIHVIMYSTNINAKDIKEFEKLGVGFLSKPFMFTTLVDDLSKILLNQHQN